MEAEGLLLKVPYEQLKSCVKERAKEVADEVAAVVDMLGEFVTNGGRTNSVVLGESDAAALEEEARGGGSCGAGEGGAMTDDVVLRDMEERLVRLKRKIGEGSQVEQSTIARCRARVAHLHELPLPGADKSDARAAAARRAWESTRLDRVLVDHLLREGEHALASRLVADVGAELLTDAGVFAAGRDVVEALRRRDCGPALAWCDKKRAKLRLVKSRLVRLRAFNLEFRLRVVEFVELVRAQRLVGAVAYARQYLAPWAETETAELQRAMACLAFKGDTACQPYAQLFSHTAWDELVESFTRENHALNALPGDSLLTAHLQAGLSALKVAHVPRGSANASREDPLHVPAFQRMSDALPFAKHTHSKLVCHVTRRIMDEDNPPMVLPNGFVYSSGAMEAMAAGAGGKVSCPRTGQGPYKLSELQKAFLA